MITIAAIGTEGQHIILHSPYHPDMVDAARQLNGNYTNGAWVFDARDEDRVREAARHAYGTDGTPTETVTVRLNLGHPDVDTDVSELFFLGRRVASRRNRDTAVQLGEGTAGDVVIITGGFDSKGGSARNPRLVPHKRTVLEVRDVPAGHHHLTHPAVMALTPLPTAGNPVAGDTAEANALRADARREGLAEAAAEQEGDSAAYTTTDDGDTTTPSWMLGEDQAPTWDAYYAACAAIGKHRDRADTMSDTLIRIAAMASPDCSCCADIHRAATAAVDYDNRARNAKPQEATR